MTNMGVISTVTLVDILGSADSTSPPDDVPGCNLSNGHKYPLAPPPPLPRPPTLLSLLLS